jgi:RNA polymerase sigma-70 factor (ECF subfamily)
LPDNQLTPSGVVSQREQEDAVRQALDRLPEHYRQVIVWRQWENLEFTVIAQRLGRSVDATRMLWWRAVERLQQEMNLR